MAKGKTEDMNALELLRFGWTPNQLKLLLVALADPGPVQRPVWVARSGVPRNHLAAILGEVQRLGGAVVEPGPEGLAIRVQPVEFWRVTPLMESHEWALAWRGVVQARLNLRTEMPSLAETMAVRDSDAPGFGVSWPTACPDSGQVCPDYGQPVKRLNDLTVDRSLAFNVERLKESPESGNDSRSGWVEPDTEEEAMAACSSMFGGPEEMRLWGGRWRNRWRANAAGLRKVLNMVREDRAVGRLEARAQSRDDVSFHAKNRTRVLDVLLYFCE